MVSLLNRNSFLALAFPYILLCVSVTFVCYCVLQTRLTLLMVVASGGYHESQSWDGFQWGT